MSKYAAILFYVAFARKFTLQEMYTWPKLCIGNACAGQEYLCLEKLELHREIESSKLKSKTKGKRKMEESNIEDKKEDTRSYFTWNLKMERVLADVLRDQRNLGHKSDRAWKAVAYNTAAQVLSTRFKVQLIGENVKNRIKLWRGWYGIVSDILSQSGFDWDGTKYMITVEDENAWNEYVKSHEEAKQFRFKVIPNWDDIVDLCAKDKANGIGGEHAVDADDAMSKEANEEEEDCNMNIGLEEQSSGTKKRGQVNRAYKSRDKEGIITSMREVVESLKEFVQVTKKRMEGNAQEVVEEVLNELRMIFDLENSQRYKAIAWLTENPNKLAILKALPLGEKKDFILAFMS